MAEMNSKLNPPGLQRSTCLPQVMEMETKRDFETIKHNELALNEISKKILTNELHSKSSNLRRVWDSNVAQGY